MDALRSKGWCEGCLIDVWHYNGLLGVALFEVTPWYLVCRTAWFWLIATLETPFWSLASSHAHCFFLLGHAYPSGFSCRGEASLEEAGRAAWAQAANRGWWPQAPHQTSGVSIITPKVNIPSSFDVQFGRVSFVEKDAGRRGQCFVLHALSMQGSPMRSFCRRCRVLEQWQMCLPLLSGEQIKCSH